MRKGPQHLYFISDRRRRYVKIGLSQDVEQRLYSLQGNCPIDLRIELVLENCGSEQERRIHHHYAQYWRHREWFNYAPEIKEAVRAAAEAGEWSWDGIRARASSYDESFGGHLTHYQILDGLRAGSLQ